MPFIYNYVREEYPYSISEIRKRFSFNAENNNSPDENNPSEDTSKNADESFKNFIDDMRKRRLIKRKFKDDEEEQEAEVELADRSDNEYSADKEYAFTFVGIAMFRNRIIYSYPKYMGTSDKDLSLEEEPTEKFGQVIRVIEKYYKEKTHKDIKGIDLFVDEDNAGAINTLSVMLFLLEDYAANGVYENDERIIEINGSGEILWQKTVDETYPMIVNNKPYYFELFTKKTIKSEFDYFKMLHEYVLTCCSREISQTKLDKFFSLPSAELSEEEETFFGDTEYILNQLDSQIRITYNDRKLSVLKAMRLYFCSDKILVGNTEIQLIGTRSFNLIWEDVCSKVFENQKGNRKKDKEERHPTLEKIEPRIDYKSLGREFENDPPTLVELIQKPIWHKNEGDKNVSATKTFNPDFLRFEPNSSDGNNNSEQTYTFYILDAKYYCPVWKDESIEKQPGVEDVAKQYLYYLAYKDILEKNNVTNVKNYFILPKRESDPFNAGYVSLEILKGLKVGIKESELGVVEVRMLDPETLYNKYLNDDHYPLSDLH